MKSTINIKRALFSGVVSGFVILIVGVGLVPIVGNQMDQALEQLSIPPLSNGAMLYFAIVSFMLGMVVMGVYAFVHDKFESKWKAIVFIALFFWFCTYFWSNAALVAYGFLSLKMVFVGTLWGFLELFMAVMIGSRIYKEKM